MKTLIGLLLALILPVSAYATEQWLPIAQIDTNGVVVYADSSSLKFRSDNSSHEVWAEVNVRAGNDGVLNVASLIFNECKFHHSGVLYLHEAYGDDPPQSFEPPKTFQWKEGGDKVADDIGKALCLGALALDQKNQTN